MGAGDTGAVMVACILAGMVREYNSTSVRVAARIGITAVVITVAELADRDQWLDLAPPSSALAATSSIMEIAEGRATSGADTALKDLESL